jgi:hypothetical protein
VQFRGSYAGLYEVALYEHNNYNGSSFVTTADLADLGPSGWGDRISSVRIRRLIDIHEPDNTCAQAIFRDAENIFDRHTFHAGDGDDWVYFDPIPGRAYVIRTLDLGPLANTILTLYRSDCTTVITSDDNGGGGNASQITWTADTNTRTYVRASSVSGTGLGRFYYLQVTYVGYPSPVSGMDKLTAPLKVTPAHPRLMSQKQ